MGAGYPNYSVQVELCRCVANLVPGEDFPRRDLYRMQLAIDIAFPEVQEARQDGKLGGKVVVLPVPSQNLITMGPSGTEKFLTVVAAVAASISVR